MGCNGTETFLTSVLLQAVLVAEATDSAGFFGEGRIRPSPSEGLTRLMRPLVQTDFRFAQSAALEQYGRRGSFDTGVNDTDTTTKPVPAV
jgi:hypothetical protein